MLKAGIAEVNITPALVPEAGERMAETALSLLNQLKKGENV